MNLKAVFLLCGKMIKLEKCSSKSNDISFDFSLKFAHLDFGGNHISVGGGAGGCSPPSWSNAQFIRANFSVRHYG